MSERQYDLKADCTFLKEGEAVCVILDQTMLPNHQVYRELVTAEDFYDAIRTLAVRGAPAIGICAAYSVYVLALKEESEDYAAFASAMGKAGEYLMMLQRITMQMP